MIAADLLPLAVDISELELFPGNPRQGAVDAIARSLNAFEQRKPIVATRAGVVVAGNHTLLAARQLGWDQIAVVWVDDDETTANAYNLADNRTADLGTYDTTALAELIRSVQDADAELLTAISYDAGDLDDFLAAMQEEGPTLIEHSEPGTRYGGGEAEGSFKEPTIEERYGDYQSKGVRSVVLDFPLDEYERVAELAARLRGAWGIASTAELFRELLERAAA